VSAHGHDDLAAPGGVNLTSSEQPPPPLQDDEVAAILSSREAGGAATRGGAMRTGGFVVNVALGALAAAFLFRHLGTKNAGIYVTALSVAGIVAAISDLGLTTLGLRELSVRDPAGRGRLMGTILGMRIGITLLGLLGSVIFAVAVGYEPILVAGVALAGVALLVTSTQATLALSLMSRLRLGLLTGLETGRQLLITVGTIALVAIGAGVLAFIGLTIPVGLLGLGITAWLVRRDVPLLPQFDRTEWRLLAREVPAFALLGTIGAIYFRLSVIVVSLTASAVQLGYFSLSFRVLEVMILLPGVMLISVFPIFVHSALNDLDRLAYAVSRVFIVSLIVGLWFSLALAIGAPIAVKIVGGAAFANATPVLRIQAIGLGGSFVNAVWGMTLISLRRYRQLVIVSLVSLVGGALLVVVLASADGAEGAAVGTAITEVAGAVLIPFVIARSDPQVLPSMSEVPRVALAAALAVLVLLIPNVPVLVQVLLATVVYVVVLLATHAIPAELRHELAGLRTRYSLRKPPA
jgi:O-antigen/teichoic acid export membrane protein